ncbi:MAG: DUF3883 domain-containing protein [Saprospiraceae bacterium]|nr:DUF3883 domain-containing protein [Saprospiraceae bacterium]
MIYNNESTELVCLYDYIQNPDGTFRSPKIRLGYPHELIIDGIKVSSVAKEIREIVRSVAPHNDWYLIWFGLESEEIVFCLIRHGSTEFNEIQTLIPNLTHSGRIEREATNFNPVIKYLEAKIDNSSTGFLQDLEIIAQTDEIPLKIIKPRFFDIERAKKAYAETGKKGEELIAVYLEKLKSGGQIGNYTWVNKSRESGFPYDFEINMATGKQIFTDVKTTSYIFEQDMIFSKNELFFMNQSSDYHIYRVFDLKEEKPSLRICEDVNTLSRNLVENITVFEHEILLNQSKLNTLKLAITPTNKYLTFSTKIELD